jgi:uncharacterized protein GlcG (DUF336 family)
MNWIFFTLFTLALFGLPAIATAAAAQATREAAPKAAAVLTERAKIEGLIAAVEKQSGATFIRNGKAHRAAEAADHLRMKWKHAGKRVKSAREFIRHIASASSLTGRKYRIRFSDGREVDAADFFLAELAKLEAPATR